jgi:hypothetical protein
MTTSKTRAKQTKGFYRPLLILALAVGGSLQLIMSALADPTPPNTAINNTATATYTDPTTGTTINTTSNTVTVSVAEVAGVTAVPVSANDVSLGGGFLPGHVVDYIFEVKNTGNDPTQFFIPSTANVSATGTQGTILISTDNGATYIAIPAGNLTPSVIAGGKVLVKVPVTIGAGVSTGDVIRVTLGDTGPNDNSQATQNVDSSTDGAGTAEIRTVDNTGTANGDTLGNPANNEREASAFQQVSVGAQLQAFAAVLKNRTGYSNSRQLRRTDSSGARRHPDFSQWCNRQQRFGIRCDSSSNGVDRNALGSRRLDSGLYQLSSRNDRQLSTMGHQPSHDRRHRQRHPHWFHQQWSRRHQHHG